MARLHSDAQRGNSAVTVGGAGNFSTTTQSNGQAITIYDPLTVTQTGTNTYTRQPFPNDTIPANRMNPVALKLVGYIPEPNQRGFTKQPGSHAQYADGRLRCPRDPHRPADQREGTLLFPLRARLPHRSERRLRLAAGAAATGNAYTDGRLSQGGNADLTSLLSPSTVLTSRVGYLRHDLWITLYASGFNPTQLGFPSSLLNTPAALLPDHLTRQLTTFGAARSGGNQFTESTDWSWSEVVNRTVRRHQVKFGGEFRVMQANINSPTTNFGTYSFNPGWTQQNALTSNGAQGNSIASLLLGMPTSGSVPINVALAYGSHYYGFFVQDDWRVSSNLTFSYGLRWDYESPITERNNQMNAGFDFTANSPVQVVDPLQRASPLKGGLRLPVPATGCPTGAT